MRKQDKKYDCFSNMLTEMSNRHFSERLFYADNVSLFTTATPYYNGNISVAQMMHGNETDYFSYSYDALNRLTSSSQHIGYHVNSSELYSYDDAGNISSLKRFKDFKLIDDLTYRYTENNEGHQLLSIRDDGEDADRYNIIEYPNGGVLTDTIMRYDANGERVYKLTATNLLRILGGE